MSNSHPYDDLLIRYLANDVTPEEQAFVEDWQAASEENKTYFEALKKAWQLTGVWNTFNKVAVDDKWNYFRETVVVKHKRRWLLPAGIAASILLVISLGLMYLNKPAIPPAVVKSTIKPPDSSATIVVREMNTTGREKNIQLPDGSLIVLADKSELTYETPFINKRQFVLKGKAWFKVAKDKTKPFTVVSGVISTTALGTEFTVTAFENAKQITVRLYEGKVVIDAAAIVKKDIYLLSGQEFVYDGKNARVRAFLTKPETEPAEINNDDIPNDRPYIPYDEEKDWYMFNNQSLNDVLQELSAIYKTQIIYNKKDLRNIKFTVRYNKTDSLEDILKRIGVINDLAITKTDTAFLIRKK